MSANRNIVNLIVCIGEILIGALLLINPMGFTTVVMVVFGIILAILGAAKVINYFRTAPEEASKNGGLVTGLLLLLGGLFCIFRWEWFIVTFPILTVVYGVVTLVNGINKVQWAIDMLRMKQKYWFIAIIGAVLTLLAGVLILVNPFTSTAVMWMFIALSMIAEAIIDILAIVFGKK